MKFKLLSFSVMLCILLVHADSAYSATYYVKKDGDDTATGMSDKEAWASISKVNDVAASKKFADGDKILFKRGDRWNQDETLGKRGDNDIDWGRIEDITIGDYDSGDKPRFNGNNFQPIQINGQGKMSGLTIKNIDISGMDWTTSPGKQSLKISFVENVTIDGIKMNGLDGASSFEGSGGIKIGRPEGKIEIINCEIFNLLHPDGLDKYNGKDITAIYIGYHVEGGMTSGSVNIQNNVIHDVESDCIQIKGIASNTQIRNNLLYNFGENAIDIKSSKNIEISYNNMYRGSFGMGGSGGGRGTIVTHHKDRYYGPPCEAISIHDNFIHSSDFIGVRLLPSGNNIKIFDNYFKNNVSSILVHKNKDVSIRNNLIVNENNGNCDGKDCSGIRVYHSPNPNVEIEQNTVYINSDNTKFGILFERDSSSTGAIIRNNIVQLNVNSSEAYPLYVDGEAGPLPEVSYNCWYNSKRSKRIFWDKNTFGSSQEQEWRDAGHAMGLFRNPGFSDVDNGDFSLVNSSPARMDSKVLGVLGLPLEIMVQAEKGTIYADSDEKLAAPDILRIAK